jgi:hypothetical protein
MSSGRADAEKRARPSGNDDRGIPLGSAVVRRDRPSKDHFLIRFPNEIVADAGISEGARLAQFYDKEAGELRIPVDE